MVDLGDDQLVAGLKGLGQVQGQIVAVLRGGHTEAYLLHLAAQEVRYGGAGRFLGIAGHGAGAEVAVLIGVVVDHIAHHGVQHQLGDLRTAGAIQISNGCAGDLQLAGRELCADRVYVVLETVFHDIVHLSMHKLFAFAFVS